MSTQKINDYLTKKIFIEKSIVTYRSISREFSIHVNDAKNELATYHENAPFQGQTCCATYLLCGEVAMEPLQAQDEYGDVNMDQALSKDMEVDSEEATQIKMTLVNEGDLEAARARYIQVISIHVYSLAPSPLIDADLICVSTADIRAVDTQRGAEFAKLIGKIIGKDVQERKGLTVREAKASLRAKKEVVNTSAVPKVPSKEAQKQDELTKEKTKPEEKPKNTIKPTGKLDFFKPKPKDTKQEEPKAKIEEKKRQFFTAPTKPKPVTRAPSAASEKEGFTEQPEKRGVKRKSIANALSDTENEPSTSDSPSKLPSHGAGVNLRIKKGVVLSDDDTEAVPQISRRKSRAASVVDSEAEREAQSLMDIDDDQVLRVSRAVEDTEIKSDTTELPNEMATEAQIDNVPMEDKPAALAKPKKKKEKKVIPVGCNGLKKKRVIKSRRVKDDKGYTITQDYSDYESVDEEEAPPPKPVAKGKKKVQKELDETETGPVKEKTIKEPVAKKSAIKPKAKTTGAAKQKGITGFFGPAKPKK
ncbi:DNA polymerase subunit Cdc27 [Cyathus striatus]|nr:DNA polymerase subunit Cdc27 [Cyathus striatus]